MPGWRQDSAADELMAATTQSGALAMSRQGMVPRL
jgi:hypothetical protein